MIYKVSEAIVVRVVAGLLNLLSTIMIVHSFDDIFVSNFFGLMAVSYILSGISRAGLDITIIKEFSKQGAQISGCYQFWLSVFSIFSAIFLSSLSYIVFRFIFNLDALFFDFYLSTLILTLLTFLILNGTFEIARSRTLLGIVHQNALLPLSLLVIIIFYDPFYGVEAFLLISIFLSVIISAIIKFATNKFIFSISISGFRGSLLFYFRSIANIPLFLCNLLISWLPILLSGQVLSLSSSRDFSASFRLLSSISMMTSGVSSFISPRLGFYFRHNDIVAARGEFNSIKRILTWFSFFIVIGYPVIYHISAFLINYSISEIKVVFFMIFLSQVFNMFTGPCGSILTMSGNINIMLRNNLVALAISCVFFLILDISEPVVFTFVSVMMVSLLSNGLNYYSSGKILVVK